MRFDFQKKISVKYLGELADTARRLVNVLNGYTGGVILSQNKKISLKDIQEFMQKNNIKCRWRNFGKDGDPELLNVDGLEYCIRDGGDYYYRIFIDERIKKLDDGTEEGKTAMKAALKEAFLHELSHVLLKHKGAFTVSEDATSDTMTKILWRNQLFMQNEKNQNLNAEILATVIGFWPVAEFSHSYAMNKFDLRSIANEYRMTVESAAQWALIQFYECEHIHYVKRIESDSEMVTPEIESSFGGLEIDVFKMQGSAASQAVCGPKKGQDTQVAGDKYVCRAFYEHRNRILGAKSDQVIVFGRLINKIYDRETEAA